MLRSLGSVPPCLPNITHLLVGTVNHSPRTRSETQTLGRIMFLYVRDSQTRRRLKKTFAMSLTRWSHTYGVGQNSECCSMRRNLANLVPGMDWVHKHLHKMFEQVQNLPDESINTEWILVQEAIKVSDALVMPTGNVYFFFASNSGTQ